MCKDDYAIKSLVVSQFNYQFDSFLSQTRTNMKAAQVSVIIVVCFTQFLIDTCLATAVTNSTKPQFATRKATKKLSDPLETAASNQAAASGRNNRQRTYHNQQDSKPKAYSYSYDTGPQYYESTSKPVKYYKEYNSPPASYSHSYNTGPQSSSHSSPPQSSSHRDSYNHQDGNEHRDGDQQTHQDHSSYGDDDEGYGGGGANEYGNSDSNDNYGEDNYGEGRGGGDYENTQGSDNRDIRY